MALLKRMLQLMKRKQYILAERSGNLQCKQFLLSTLLNNQLVQVHVQDNLLIFHKWNEEKKTWWPEVDGIS